MITLKHAMELAGKNLIKMLSPEQNYLPYFWMRFDAEKRAKMQMRWASHNIGRWWDAILRLEEATGFVVPAEIEKAMLGNIASCLQGPLGLCRHIPEDCAFDGHSHREIFMGLACLVRFRKNNWALDAGKQLVRKLDEYILVDGSWDLIRMSNIAKEAGTTIEHRLKYFNEHALATHGRLIEGLIEFYQATGDEATLLLADRLARFHFEFSTREDGSVPPAEYTHTHSLFGLYRGLLLYGIKTCQPKYIDRIATVYINTVRPNFKPSGFISHDWGMEKAGETSAPGDAAQLALWLTQVGRGDFLDDAERWVRSRILPSQIVVAPGLKPQIDDDKDEHKHLDERAIGAFGGMHMHPHGGKLSTLDITASDLHSLCDIYTHEVEQSDTGLYINFHFDFEDERVRVICSSGKTRKLEIVVKIPQNIFIRIPFWAPIESVRLSVDGKLNELQWIGHKLFIGSKYSPKKIKLEYELPIKTTEETLDAVTYHIKWQGDEILGITPNTEYLPFYPNMPLAE